MKIPNIFTQGQSWTRFSILTNHPEEIQDHIIKKHYKVKDIEFHPNTNDLRIKFDSIITGYMDDRDIHKLKEDLKWMNIDQTNEQEVKDLRRELDPYGYHADY